MLATQRPRTAGRSLLSPAARRPAAALIIACVIITAVLGGLVSGESRADRLDAWADGHINTWLGGHAWIADIINLGEPVWVVAICAVAVAALLLTRRWRGALLVAIAVPLAGLLAERILKPLFDRTSQGALEYPSGHTTAVTTMVVVAIVVLTGPARPPLPAGLRWALCAALLVLIPWVAVGLVIVHFHYFSDTIGGAGTGITVALGTALGVDAAAARLGRRLRPEAPARADPAATVPARRNESP